MSPSLRTASPLRRLGRSPEGMDLLDTLLPDGAPSPDAPPDQPAPASPGDFWSPYLTETEVEALLGLEAPPPPPPPPSAVDPTEAAGALLPPPPVPNGEPIDWSLHGIDAEPDETDGSEASVSTQDPAAGAADPPAPKAPRRWLRKRAGDTEGRTAAASEPVHHCPECRAPAHVGLTDRSRGVQHLSCSSCFKMWQEWIAAA